MYDVLSNMDPQRRDQLINSALEEFGLNKFEKASTNTIVKNAGISKGLLYHYFPSKDSLYKYLELFSINIIAKTIMDKIIWKNSDLLKRIKQIALAKFQIFMRYPHLLTFINAVYKNKSVTEIKKVIEFNVPDIYQHIYHKNINFDLFKDDLDLKRTIKLIQWTIENLCEEWLNNSFDPKQSSNYEELEKEIDLYMQIFKEAFYK